MKKTHNELLERRTVEVKFRKLYRECTHNLAKLVSQYQELKECSDYNALLQVSFLADGRKFHDKLCKLRSLTDKFQTQTTRAKDNPTCHLDEIQSMMTKIESMLTQYKSDESIMAEVLLRDEVILWQDCLLMDQRITCWDDEQQNTLPVAKLTADGCSQPRHKAPLHFDVTKDLPAEIAAFQHFLDSTGGRLGGWTEKEHNTFLRLRVQHTRKGEAKKKLKTKSEPTPENVQSTTTGAIHTAQNGDCERLHADEKPPSNSLSKHISGDNVVSDEPSAFHCNVSLLLGTRNPAEVQQHEEWWIKLQELDVARRQALQRWKARRFSAKCPSTTDPSCGQTMPRSNSLHKIQPLTPAQLEAQKSALDKWRTEREEFVKTMEKAKLNAEEQAKQAQLKELEQRRAELHKRVAEYQAVKQTEKTESARELALHAEESRISHRLRLAQSINRIKQRNTHLIEEQIARRQAPKLAEKQRAALIEKALSEQPPITARRDRKRLTQWTKGWQSRLAAGGEATHVTTGLNLAPMGSGRAIPEWRKGL